MSPPLRKPIYFADGAAFAEGLRDGQRVWKFRCPECHAWGDINDDQLHGRVSIDHSGTVVHRADGPFTCTYHQTRNVWAEFSGSNA